MQESPWDQHWGMEYDPSLKRDMTRKFIAAAEECGQIGERVVEVGSGICPLTRLLQKHHQLIHIDIAGHTSKVGNKLHLRLDAEQLLDRQSHSTRKALGLIARFIGVDAQDTKPPIDSFFFSDILNYIDWQKVLAEANRYLKPGGSFVIFNKPGRGFPPLFSSEGLKDNTLLLDFLRQQRHAILVEDYLNEDEKADSTLFLISQKQS